MLHMQQKVINFFIRIILEVRTYKFKRWDNYEYVLFSMSGDF